MIAEEIYKYLKESTALAALLSADVKDSKIYPVIAKGFARPPFIVYRLQAESSKEVLKEANISFALTVLSYDSLCKISSSIEEALDNNTSVDSEKFYIYFSKHTGSIDGVDDIGRLTRNMIFNFKFKDK
ncbi:hypothetical protein Dip518_000007 [Parelusimicrobium proximum]|uniref:hypothetical protein n=1 Tax=Parelusimicrobium proximum TaxID=3228953 RepID=UPI003D16F178